MLDIRKRSDQIKLLSCASSQAFLGRFVRIMAVEFPKTKPRRSHEDPTLFGLRGRLSLTDEAKTSLESMDLSPCNRACPVGTDVKRYVTLASEARFQEAEAVIRRDNPMAAVCGFLCSRPCELQCTRQMEQGAPVPIRMLKRFACRFVFDDGLLPCPVEIKARKERVAVVGSGPSGLSAARDLALEGFHVTVLEARDRPGGLLAREVPGFVLPGWALEQDISAVEALGVEIRCNAAVQGDGAVEALLAEHDAVLLAIGSGKGLKTGLPGEEGLDGVVDALSLLFHIEEGERENRGGAGIVVGGSPMAVSAARALLRSGLGKVSLVFPGTVEQLGCDPAHLDAARKEGVEIRCRLLPVEAMSVDGRFAGLVCKETEPMLPFVPGRPLWKTGSSTELHADLLVPAVDRMPDLTRFKLPDKAGVTMLGTLKVDPETMGAGAKGLFAAGEAATGPRGVVEAVASGRQAARSIAAFLNGTSVVNGAPVASRDPAGPSRKGFRLTLAAESPGRSGSIDGFEGRVDRVIDLEEPYPTEHEAVQKARTCLRCGPCSYCGSCSIHCPDRIFLSSDQDLIRAAKQPEPMLERLNMIRLVALVDPMRCIGCGRCEEVCPYQAARVRFHQSASISEIDVSACRGCGHCASRCPATAITYPFSNTESLRHDPRSDL